jgi:hypothetical protein
MKDACTLAAIVLLATAACHNSSQPFDVPRVNQEPLSIEEVDGSKISLDYDPDYYRSHYHPIRAETPDDLLDSLFCLGNDFEIFDPDLLQFELDTSVSFLSAASAPYESSHRMYLGWERTVAWAQAQTTPHLTNTLVAVSSKSLTTLVFEVDAQLAPPDGQWNIDTVWLDNHEDVPWPEILGTPEQGMGSQLLPVEVWVESGGAAGWQQFPNAVPALSGTVVGSPGRFYYRINIENIPAHSGRFLAMADEPFFLFFYVSNEFSDVNGNGTCDAAEPGTLSAHYCGNTPADSDEDGVCDALDACQGNDHEGDLDGDGWCNGHEDEMDRDGDGMSRVLEAQCGSNDLDPFSRCQYATADDQDVVLTDDEIDVIVDSGMKMAEIIAKMCDSESSFFSSTMCPVTTVYQLVHPTVDVDFDSTHFLPWVKLAVGSVDTTVSPLKCLPANHQQTSPAQLPDCFREEAGKYQVNREALRFDLFSSFGDEATQSDFDSSAIGVHPDWKIPTYKIGNVEYFLNACKATPNAEFEDASLEQIQGMNLNELELLFEYKCTLQYGELLSATDQVESRYLMLLKLASHAIVFAENALLFASGMEGLELLQLAVERYLPGAVIGGFTTADALAGVSSAANAWFTIQLGKSIFDDVSQLYQCHDANAVERLDCVKRASLNLAVDTAGIYLMGKADRCFRNTEMMKPYERWKSEFKANTFLDGLGVDQAHAAALANHINLLPPAEAQRYQLLASTIMDSRYGAFLDSGLETVRLVNGQQQSVYLGREVLRQLARANDAVRDPDFWQSFNRRFEAALEDDVIEATEAEGLEEMIAQQRLRERIRRTAEGPLCF